MNFWYFMEGTQKKCPRRRYGPFGFLSPTVSTLLNCYTQELKEVFRVLDDDGDGLVQAWKLCQALAAMSDITLEEAKQVCLPLFLDLPLTSNDKDVISDCLLYRRCTPRLRSL